MKAVILAGGFGTRLSEETILKPKPMVEIGGRPILLHIMNIYAFYGITEFIIALGYKGESLKEYFLNFYAFNNNITIDLATGETTIHDGNQPKWKIHLIDTGLNTQTGGRLKRLRSWLNEDEPFMFTYGDGVADIDLEALVAFHKSHNKLATVTTVRSPSRFGRIVYDGDRVIKFYEKPSAGAGWINGGFFVLHTDAIDYVEGDHSIWERDAIERLASDNQLAGFRHDGFWSCMDTLKEKNFLEDLWVKDQAPWKIW
jgi:glucose-1-phosphate cytidylyltransferase